MNSLLAKVNKKNTSKSQAAFSRLIKKITGIQRSIKENETILNHALQYYHSTVRPIEQEMLNKLFECIPIFYSYYKNPHSKLSKNDIETLKQLIASLNGRLVNYITPFEIPEKLVKIINDIEGIDIKETMKNELDSLKNDVSDYSKAYGFDIDLSDMGPTDSMEELMAKLQQALFKAKENKQAETSDTDNNTQGEQVKKKTKQQLKKEQREKDVEEIQKKSLSTIYKQLAKAFHPDLELDPSAKAEKEALMKRLTVAYENQDLHTLLSLEIAWMNRTASNTHENPIQEADEQLKIYNTLLKDQAISLQEELDRLFMHPRYFDIHHILNKCRVSSILETLEDEKAELLGDCQRYSLAILDLKDGSNFKRMKEILKEFSSELAVFEMINLLALSEK